MQGQITPKEMPQNWIFSRRFFNIKMYKCVMHTPEDKCVLKKTNSKDNNSGNDVSIFHVLDRALFSSTAFVTED